MSSLDWKTALKDASYKMGQSTKTMATLAKHLSVMKDCWDSGHKPGVFALKDVDRLTNEVEDKFVAASRFYSDLLKMEPPDMDISAKLAEDLARMEEQRETIRGTTVVVTCEPLPAVPPPAPSRPLGGCLLYTSPSPRDGLLSRMPSSA